MLAKKIGALLATASIGIVTLCAVAFPSQGVNGIYAEESSAYSITYHAGDAHTDGFGTYLLSEFGYKIYFAATDQVSFGTNVSDGYLIHFAGNGGWFYWDNGQAPKDGVGSINANGFKNLKSISMTWDTAGISGLEIHAYNGNFNASGSIVTPGQTITDTISGCTFTYVNAAWNGSLTTAPVKITSMTITYSCS